MSTSSSPKHLTLLLLVDALRADYVKRAPYLARLARTSATGAFRECFGFVPRAAYFGGLDAGQYGFTNMYCYDPGASPFSAAAALPVAHVPQSPALRRAVEETSRNRLTPFARAYASTVEIPLPFASHFDLVEKRAPWERHVGYRSLFHLLDEFGVPWYQAAWPGTNQWPDHSDAGIVERTLSELQPEHRFAFVHLQELDGAGHAFGPGSQGLHRQLAQTDRCCARLIETLRQQSANLDVVLFGDHGMVNVTRTLDLGPVLERTGLQFGVDYAYFLDSTMARFWFHHARARAQLVESLSTVSGGRILSPDELEHHGIANCDSRNGEMFFLADPGVLLFPNFFQGHGEPIKGMHGYDPDCPDNLGYFLMQSPRHPEWAGTATGAINPPQLFPLLCHLLDLPATSPSGPLIDVLSHVPRGRFTRQPEPAAERRVQEQLDEIVGRIRERCGDPRAIILTGSFGRGEGGVFCDSEDVWRPVNDYDLLVVDERDLSEDLKGLGAELAAKLGIDFVDIAWSNGQWSDLGPSVLNFDLKYGSQLLEGDATVLDAIPAFAPSDIPIYEAVKLLFNRTAGILTGLRGEFFAGTTPTADQQRYLTNQIMKAWMAIGDWHLIRWEGYDSSYQCRAERFQTLASGAGLSPDLVAAIVGAYEFKCLPHYDAACDTSQAAALYPHLKLALIHAINLQTEGHARDLAGSVTEYHASMSADRGWVSSDNSLCAAHPQLQAVLRSIPPGNCSLRHLVYSALPFLLGAALCPDQREGFWNESIARLKSFFHLPPRRAFTWQAWEALRAFLVKIWFATCH